MNLEVCVYATNDGTRGFHDGHQPSVPLQVVKGWHACPAKETAPSRLMAQPARLSRTHCARVGVADEHTSGVLSVVALLAQGPTGPVRMPAGPVAFIGKAAGLECVTDRPEDGNTPGDVPFA